MSDLPKISAVKKKSNEGHATLLLLVVDSMTRDGKRKRKESQFEPYYQVQYCTAQNCTLPVAMHTVPGTGGTFSGYLLQQCSNVFIQLKLCKSFAD